jgi:hypothetical protein
LRKDVDLDFGADPAGVVIRLPQAMRAREGIISAQRAGGVGPIERIGACGIEIAAAGQRESGRFVAVAMNEQGVLKDVRARRGEPQVRWVLAIGVLSDCALLAGAIIGQSVLRTGTRRKVNIGAWSLKL